MQTTGCPVCYSIDTGLLRTVSHFQYFQCKHCEVIFISPDVLDKMNNGELLIEYNHHYWRDELYAAKERSWGTTLARVAEVFLYARRPLNKFIDIGSGPGYFLDALQYQLPSNSETFYAAELFPPAEEYCTQHPNYHRGSLLDLDFTFDGGCCIEVVEHLTPRMLKNLLFDIAAKSVENSIYIFNTGMVDYILHEDINYLDHIVRGHVMGWSIKALQYLAKPIGFDILPIPGKTWAFIAEYKPDHQFNNPLTDRIWAALPENKQKLRDEKTGDLMYILGLETTRAYV